MVDGATKRSNSFHDMNAMTLEYADLPAPVMVKIWQLADLLGVTPKRACEIYLSYIAKSRAGAPA